MFASMDWVVVKNHSTFRYFWLALVLVAPLCAAALTQGIPAASTKSGAGNDTLASIAVVLSFTAVFYRLAPFEIPSSYVQQLQRTNALTLAGLARKYGADRKSV